MDADEKLDPDDAALLSALEAGELDGAGRARAEALLSRSAAARRTLVRLERLRASTTSLGDAPLSPDARRRIGERALAAFAAGRRRRRALPIALVAAAAALVAAWVALRRPVAPSDEVRTGAGETRLVAVGDRASAFVSERSVVLVGRGAPLRVVQGRVRVVVRPEPSTPFYVETAAARATVHGTEFDVDVRGDLTEVRVFRGEVELANALGARTLWAGETADARVGQAPRRVEHIAPALLD